MLSRLSGSLKQWMLGKKGQRALNILNLRRNGGSIKVTAHPLTRSRLDQGSLTHKKVEVARFEELSQVVSASLREPFRRGKLM